jgi:hypothetical protein
LNNQKATPEVCLCFDCEGSRETACGPACLCALAGMLPVAQRTNMLPAKVVENGSEVVESHREVVENRLLVVEKASKVVENVVLVVDFFLISAMLAVIPGQKKSCQTQPKS